MRKSLRSCAGTAEPTKNSPRLARHVGTSLAMACLATGASAQDGDVIVLPPVNVETSAAPAPVAARPAPRAPAAPTVCTPALAGTPVCAAQEAAAREAAEQARAEAQAAAQAAALAAAQAKAAAGTSSYADPDAPFKANTLANSRMSGPIKENPRTVTAITQEVLEVTGTTSVREIARSTPGISLGFGEGGNSFGDNIYIRGFKANNDVYTDGIRSAGVGISETFNTEQVEISKGPAGTVGGRGTTGGALDIVSKRPQDVDFVRSVTTATDAGTIRQSLDVNEVMSDDLNMRLNLMYQDGEVAGRDNVDDDRMGGAVALQFKPSDALTINADYSYTKIDQTPDWGVPYVNNTDLGIIGPVTEFGVDPSSFYGVVGRDYQEATQSVATVKAAYEFANGLTLTNTLRSSASLNDYVLTAPSNLNDNDSADPADWTVGLSSKSWYQETDVLTDVLELSGDTVIGNTTHKFVLGASYSKEEIYKLSYSNLTSEDYQNESGGSACTVSAINPDAIGEGCWDGERPVLGDTATTTNVETTSLYILDTVELSPQWTINGGLRVDMYDIERTGVSRGTPYSLSRDDVMVNWNLGANYALNDRLNLYAAAATSTNPMGQELEAGGSFYGGLDENGAVLAPEKNTSFEIGAKYELNPHLLLTAALFETSKDNAREDVGPRGASVTSDTLEYRMRGIELGVSGNLTERVSLFGGATFMESKITDSVDTDTIGSSVANIAHKQLNLLATYQVTDQLMLGGRVNFTGGRDLGSIAANGRTLPSSLTFDLLGEYEFAENKAVKFGVTNITDETVYDAGYRSGTPFTYVAPGREISVSLDMKF